MGAPVPSLKILVADDERDMRDFYEKILRHLGHQVVGVASNGKELVEKCRATQPDLIISDVRMPGMDGLDAAAELSRGGLIPIILVSAHHEPDLVGRALTANVLAYLVKPIDAIDLGPALNIAVRWSEELRALRQEAAELRQALEDRKTIERAKGLLMSKANLDEATAFRRLQKLARDQNKRVIDVARMIIDAAAAFEAAEPAAAPAPRRPRMVRSSPGVGVS